MKASEDDIRALDEADTLLRFAAERVTDLNPDLSLAVSESRAALEGGLWSPQIAQRFWTAYAKLCGLIRPVTTDCLAEGSRRVSAFRWVPWKRAEEITVAERSSAHYLRIMIVLLLMILPLQLYVWIGTNLSKKVDALFAETRGKIAQLARDSNELRAAMPAQERTGTQAPDERTAVIKRRAEQFDTPMERILDSVALLEKLTTFAREPTVQSPVELINRLAAEGVGPAELAVRRFELLQTESGAIIENANLLTGVIGSFVLPILFGVIGAVAYIIRSISDEIRNVTFSATSPIRHVMRVALGALAGIVVGLFGGLSNQLSLSPLAIAFLAGYGAEAVFSMFDGLIQKFRQVV